MLTLLHAVAYTVIALWLLTIAGNWLCRLLFKKTGLKGALVTTQGREKPEEVSVSQPAGRTIGGLERIILAIGVVCQRWEILAAVVALKTVARFKELDEQISAEYFLVGSLFSVLWAMLITAAWLGYDHYFGMDLHQMAAVLPHP